MKSPGVIATTDQWFVIDKPSGWLTIPGREGQDKTPVPVLSEWVQEKLGTCFTVHRLDRETSGVILFARTADDHRTAGMWFQNHQIKKTYICLAEGRPQLPVFKVNLPIGHAPSVTQFEVREKFQGPFGDAFLAYARPQSGRRHQIRIHLAEQGFPILGDTHYKGSKNLADRVALHALSLELPSGEGFKSELPADFNNWLSKLREST